MLIAVQDWMFYGVALLSFFLFIAAIGLYMAIRNNAPDAMVHWQAKRQGKKICRVHFRGKVTSDYIAEEKKEEKELGSPYWIIPILGIKFKPEADAIHFIEGSIPCCDYYENTPKSIKIEVAVAFSQLKDYFKNKLNIPIEGIEDLAFYIQSETDIVKSGVETAIKDARINSEETKQVIRRFIATTKKNEEKLKSMKLESGYFTWQTAMNALDSTIAYTSSALTHALETVRAAERRREENKRKDIMMYAVIAVILAIAGIILLYGIKGLT